jgi:hypothetical protein
LYGLPAGLAAGLLYRPVARLAGRRVAGFAAGLLGGLTAAVVAGLVFELTAGLLLGIPAALLAGLAGDLVLGRRQPARVVVRMDRELLRTLRGSTGFGLPAGLGAGLSAGLVFGLPFGLPAGLVAGLVFGLLIMAGFGLWFGLMRESDRVPTPGFTLRADRAATAFSVLAGELLGALAAGLLVALRSGVEPRPAFSLLVVVTAIGLGVGLVAGLLVAARRPWPRYQLARAELAVSGRLPWRLMSFLEDAHRRGLLRQVGAVYQFRHARLQDRLAGGAPAQPS